MSDPDVLSSSFYAVFLRYPGSQKTGRKIKAPSIFYMLPSIHQNVPFLSYGWTHVIQILWGFGNLFELDNFSNHGIFGYISEI